MQRQNPNATYFLSSLTSAMCACCPASDTAFINASALFGVGALPERMLWNVMLYVNGASAVVILLHRISARLHSQGTSLRPRKVEGEWHLFGVSAIFVGGSSSSLIH
jgi:hypothetical protein